MREALQKRADNAEKRVSQIRARQHSDEELAHAAEAYQEHRQALDGYQCISNAGLTVDTCHIPLMGIQGTSEVPEIRLSPQRETRGTSKVPQQHNSLMRELLIPVLEPVKLLVFGIHMQSPKSFYHDVTNKKRYLILCCSTTLEII